MNETAKNLGALNSNFKSPSGIHDDDHYTTAYDLSLIAREAMKNPTFRSIVSTYKYTMPPTNRSKESRTFINTNKLLCPGEYNFKEATGIKTGYTSQAGNCLISSATKDNIELIAVVLGGYNVPGDKSAAYTDTINLLNFGFNNYSRKCLLNAGSCVKQINPNKSVKATLNLIAENSIDVLVENGTSPEFKQIINLKPNISAPIKAKDILGTVSYYLGDKKIGTTNLLAQTDIEKEAWYFILLRVLLSIVLSIIILCIVLRIFNEIRRKIRKGKR
jgi:D-alanyl-D-alanine carboxypeptidase (penicillin-binding protein 5/6)